MALFDNLTGLFNRKESEDAAQEKFLKAAETGDKKEIERIVGNFRQATRWSLWGGPAHVIAARHGHNDVMLFLLENGADMEARNFSGHTALAAAASMGQEKTARLLIERGAKPEGMPLAAAERAEKPEIVKMMHQAAAIREAFLAGQKSHTAAAIEEDIRQGTDGKVGLMKKIRLRLKKP